MCLASGKEGKNTKTWTSWERSILYRTQAMSIWILFYKIRLKKVSQIEVVPAIFHMHQTSAACAGVCEWNWTHEMEKAYDKLILSKLKRQGKIFLSILICTVINSLAVIQMGWWEGLLLIFSKHFVTVCNIWSFSFAYTHWRLVFCPAKLLNTFERANYSFCVTKCYRSRVSIFGFSRKIYHFCWCCFFLEGRGFWIKLSFPLKDQIVVQFTVWCTIFTNLLKNILKHFG